MKTIENGFLILQQSELDRILKDAVKEAMQRTPVRKLLNLDEAVSYLTESGIPVCKSAIYKCTMNKTIPFTRFGERRIIFNVDDLDQWVEDRLEKKQNTVAESVRQAAKKKI